MDINIIETRMDEHLLNVQRETKAALDGFGESGMKMDKKFISHFLKATIDRLTHTCERYGTESKWKITHKTSIATAAAAAATTSTRVGVLEVIDLTRATNHTVTKRTLENTAGTEHSKKMRKLNETDRPNETKVAVNNKHVHENLKYTTFFCFYCLNRNDFGVTKSFNGTIDGVYGHWLANHATESVSKPFKFYAVAMAACFHCNDVGIYHDLEKYHMEKHSGEQFAIFDPKELGKCGVCHFKDGDLIEHFKTKHNTKVMSMIFNPIYYSEQRIDDLLTINVHKKHQCGECNEIFETHREIAIHFRVAHIGRTVQSKEYVDNRNTLDHLICGYCQKKVNCTRLLNHFRDHSYYFICSKCQYQTEDMSELIFHEKTAHNIEALNSHCDAFSGWMKNKFFNTDMVFSNGLTLKLFNVQETKFDDSKLFDMFIEGFLDLKKESAKNMIELNGTTVTLVNTENSTTSQSEAVSTVSIVAVESLLAPSRAISTVTSNERPSASLDDSIIIRELYKQQALAKNVYVHGITSELNIKNPYPIFLKFCRKLGVYVARASIETIIQREDGLVVKFYEIKTKRLLLSQAIGFVWTNDLIPWHTNRAPWEVRIQNHMTPFYVNIQLAANKLKRLNLLHSYKLVENGFMIRITATGAEHIVQSKGQLFNIVYPRD